MIALDRSDFWTFARMDAVLKTSKNAKVRTARTWCGRP
jgi:hypothetical protein